MPPRAFVITRAPAALTGYSLKFCSCRSCDMLVFVEDASESVASADVEVIESAVERPWPGL